MITRRSIRVAVAFALATVVAASFAAPASAKDGQRYVITARTGADLGKIAARARARGALVVRTVPALRMVVVRGPRSVRSLALSRGVTAVSRDHVMRLVDPDRVHTLAPKLRKLVSRAPAQVPPPLNFRVDPALRLPGLLWDYARMRVRDAWQRTTGSPRVTVAVSDTGLDYTHVELRGKVKNVVDFADHGEENICKILFGVGDRDIAKKLGVPFNLDFNGHGSWIGGNIAAKVNGTGTNGIAPGVELVSLKIGGWCGFGYDSDILTSFVWAADHGVDVVNNSFGGYLDRRDPDQNAVWRAYRNAVRYARSRGTIIVASAGNEHVRVGPAGRVLSRGQLTAPGDPLVDLHGLYEVPGGIPGVVDVSSTGNRVVAPSAHCAPGTIGSAADTNATCKPRSDRHDPVGVGKIDQLAYYSDYGPRIDIAGQGGARKFNLPVWDRGGTPGFPYTTADGTEAFEDFSITSNFAQEIPCFHLSGPVFRHDQCYSTIQGTSMAAPHVTASLALVASAFPSLRGKPAALIATLERHTDSGRNTTPGLLAGDHSPGDLRAAYPKRCASGYCHLGGRAISSGEAYGAGLVDVGFLGDS